MLCQTLFLACVDHIAFAMNKELLNLFVNHYQTVGEENPAEIIAFAKYVLYLVRSRPSNHELLLQIQETIENATNISFPRYSYRSRRFGFFVFRFSSTLRGLLCAHPSYFAPNRDIVHRYLGIGTQSHPTAEIIESFLERIDTFNLHMSWIINCVLSKSVLIIDFSCPPPITPAVFAASASLLNAGVQSIISNSPLISDAFLEALASSGAASTLSRLLLSSSRITDASSSCWKHFAALKVVSLNHSTSFSETSVLEVMKIPSIAVLEAVSETVDALSVLEALALRPTLKKLRVDTRRSPKTLEDLLPLFERWQGRETMKTLYLNLPNRSPLTEDQQANLLQLFPNIRSFDSFALQSTPSQRPPRDLEEAIESPEYPYVDVLNFEFPANTTLSPLLNISSTSLRHVALSTQQGVSLGARNAEILVYALSKAFDLNSLTLSDHSSYTKQHAEILLTSLPKLEVFDIVNESDEFQTEGVIYVSHLSLKSIPTIRVVGCNETIPVRLPCCSDIYLHSTDTILPVLNTNVIPYPQNLEIRKSDFDAEDAPANLLGALNFYASSLRKLRCSSVFTSWFTFDAIWMLTQIRLETCKMNQGALERLMASCPLLIELRLHGLEDHPPDWSVQFSNLDWLTHKSLRECHIYRAELLDASSEFLIDKDHLPQLETLSFTNIYRLGAVIVCGLDNIREITVSLVEPAFPARIHIANCPSLAILDIVASDDVNYALIGELTISNVPRLTSLKLGGGLERAIEAGAIALQLPRLLKLDILSNPAKERVGIEIKRQIMKREPNTIFTADDMSQAAL